MAGGGGSSGAGPQWPVRAEKYMCTCCGSCLTKAEFAVDHGRALGFTGFLGVASFIGVIASHVIVLFDFIEEKHVEGEALEQALLDAGHADTLATHVPRQVADGTNRSRDPVTPTGIGGSPAPAATAGSTATRRGDYSRLAPRAATSAFPDGIMESIPNEPRLSLPPTDARLPSRATRIRPPRRSIPTLLGLAGSETQASRPGLWPDSEVAGHVAARTNPQRVLQVIECSLGCRRF